MAHNGPVRWLRDLAANDASIAGGKGANLGELIRAGLPVPPGFVITAEAYERTMECSRLRTELVASAADAPTAPAALSELATVLGRRIRDVEIPAEIAGPILAAYRQLDEPAVAVRSSATAEDTDGTSFAGMSETFTNVGGEAELLTCVKECWASAYGARAIAYRASRQISDRTAIAVVVQAMVDSERSGVVLSADPITGDRERVVIEGAFGLGEVVAAGQLVPDTYILDHHGPRLLEIRIGDKKHKIVRGAEGHDVRVDLPLAEATSRVLSDEEAVALARLAVRVQDHYGSPQDIEWAIQGGVIQLVQSRPITTLDLTTDSKPDGPAPVRGRLVAGAGAARGIASGPVRILTSPDHTGEFRDGEILVAPMTSPDWVPLLRRAAALVTDGGGITCHAAIVSRELGIPAVVGTRCATHVLHDGQLVTVDGSRGVVEEGTSTFPTSATVGSHSGLSPLLGTDAASKD